ncbi:MAG TPA: alpha/beta hydrolase [Longimicrobiales bacterium]|nr:alpha/beta hydrolase [Longimicrobiales bacterium]
MSLVRTAISSSVAALAVLLASERLPAQDMALRADSVEVNGTWIHYGVAGHGPPLLLLHGFTGAGTWWEPYLDRLAEHYTTIVPDLPGHGRSGAGPDPYRFDHVAADMHAFMDAVGVGRFRAVGYSGGGIVLLHMAAQAPRRIESMAVMSASHAPAKAAIVAFPSFEDQSAQVKEYWLKVHPGGEPQVSELIGAFRGLGEFVDEVTITPRQLSTIESRTLVVIGDRDPLVPVHDALEMYEAIPVAALWVIPTNGHPAMWPDWGGSVEAASILPDVLTHFLGSEPLEAPPKR